ncbi:Hypothetical protein KpB31_0032 [Klebsiella pneumoniae]|nr:hypothetical protein A79E_0032 [Klebsiella pneumoniae subsp. pneumoniae 1084]AIK81947.1 hypothetical protein VK055_3390 [Klebsiella pneumoniae subsp. pneumoniae]AJC02156.1 hypothetical protein P243_0035 [Klebsiella pneumoniae subsp. pneumoniae 1158]AUB45442.1 hypothetical protein SGH10_000032 [Klebsiella pneumoniae]CCM90987.1 hypothetical protein BN427_4866 [Klebsiella pneumoniae subsp. pneumoniae ST258-K28BO]CDK60573.1 hypothetical protein [Klebsiella pneumoniae IS10]CDK70209.1 hypothetic
MLAATTCNHADKNLAPAGFFVFCPFAPNCDLSRKFSWMKINPL